MLDFIIFIFIIYIICKKYNKNSSLNLINTLQRKGYSNVSIIQQNASNIWITANFHGDNYLFEQMKNDNVVTYDNINTLIEYSAKHHYHNIILITGNSTISDTAKCEIEKYNIEVWDSSKLRTFSNINIENTSSPIRQKQTDDTCEISEAEDPIQDGRKANSFFRSLFKHKIEKL